MKFIGRLVFSVIVLFALFLIYAKIVEFTPSDREAIAVAGDAETMRGDTITMLSWNIGYAGLGRDMDFFMDGGQSSRTSRGRTLENLEAIVSLLKSHSKKLDFILLQEVDVDSKRSYGINIYDTIIKSIGMDFKGYYADNFDVFYVPIPLSDPIGGVQGGLATFSRYTPRSATRLAYPNSTSWPQSMFDLKRGMLSLAIAMSEDRTLYVNNTHNSAYDSDGEARTKEMVYIKEYLDGFRYSVTAGDWNSTPPDYIPSQRELSDEHFQVHSLSHGDFNSDFHFTADLDTKSVRYGYEPYKRNSTTTSIIDFALSSADVVPLSVMCLDLGFENSDHNPVFYKFLIKR